MRLRNEGRPCCQKAAECARTRKPGDPQSRIEAKQCESFIEPYNAGRWQQPLALKAPQSLVRLHAEQAVRFQRVSLAGQRSLQLPNIRPTGTEL